MTLEFTGNARAIASQAAILYKQALPNLLGCAAYPAQTFGDSLLIFCG